ncbi:hypothetical protein PPSIR1_22119 [Plesiocystis pacifica SIR-1]|uniref:Uncharacterized protein n=2 Tax=Plesiocystis pacifica TaxID=191768 RepID=A6FXS1_9BACT|nr:hypothetical protein PPSIR1_22119 [Plesiocystis pacifica SIR-1]
MLENPEEYSFGDDPLAAGATEFPGASVEWALPDPDVDPAERRLEISVLVEDLWKVAAAWTMTRTDGDWCDFRLVGYDVYGEQVIAVGRRLVLVNQTEDATDPELPKIPKTPPRVEQPSVRVEPSRPRIGPRSRREPNREAEWYERQRADAKIDAHLDRLAAANEAMLDHVSRALDMATSSIAAAPDLVRGAREIMRESINEQREMFDRYRDLQDGKSRMQEQVVREEHKTKRREQLLGLFHEVTKIGAALAGPVIQEGARIYLNPEARLITQYDRAQQAIGFILHSLQTPTLLKIFKGKRDQASAFLTVLNTAMITENEREALLELDPILPVLRSETFDEAVSTQLRYAATYIMGRIAFYQIPYYAEGA